MKQHKNMGLIILIVVLLVLVIGLAGYIVYDKVLNKNDLTNNKENVIVFDTLEQHQKERDKTVNSDENNNKIYTVIIKDINLSYYVNHEEGFISNLKINNNLTSFHENMSYYSYANIVKFGDYLVLTYNFAPNGYSNLIAYDLNGKSLGKFDIDSNNGLFSFEDGKIKKWVLYGTYDMPDMPARTKIVRSLDQYCEENATSVDLTYDITVEYNQFRKRNELTEKLVSKNCSYRRIDN